METYKDGPQKKNQTGPLFLTKENKSFFHVAEKLFFLVVEHVRRLKFFFLKEKKVYLHGQTHIKEAEHSIHQFK